MDVDGDNLRMLADEANVVEITIPFDGQKIYYTKSGGYYNSSPIATPRFHDFDFYSMNFDGSNIEKISNINAYYLDGLAVSLDEKKLFSNQYVFNVESDLLQQYYFDIFGAFGVAQYPISNISSDGKYIARVDEFGPKAGTGYALSLFSFTDNKIVKRLVDGYIYSPKIFNNQEKIIFLKEGSLWTINVDGSNLEKIEIKI